MTIRDFQLQSLQEFLLSGRGIAVMALGFMALIFMFISPRMRWWGMAAMVFATGLATVPGEFYKSVLIGPLETLRTSGRAISSALILMLVLPMLSEPRRVLVGISKPMVMFLLFAFAICMHEILLGTDFSRGIIAILLYPSLFTIFGIAIARTLDSVESVDRWIEMIAMSYVMMVSVTLVQSLIDADQIVHGQRMFGLTANPNMLSAYLACGVPAVCYLISRTGSAFWLRLFYSMLLGLMGVFLLWTGSRGGMLMAIVGIVGLFRLRIGKFALTAIAGVSCYLIARQFFGAGVDISDRAFTFENTRSLVWSNMLAAFIRNPIFGTGSSADIGGSENSFLLTAAKYGMIGLLPLLLFTVMLVMQMIRLERLRAHLPPREETVVRLINGTLAALLIGANFDAWFLSLWAPFLCVLLLMLAMATAAEQRYGMLVRGFEVEYDADAYGEPALH